MQSGSSRSRTFKIGDFECHVMYDGSRSVGAMTTSSPRKFLFGDAPDIELDKGLVPHGGFDSSTVLPFNYLLVRDGRYNILVDTGCGDQAQNERHPLEPAGLLAKSLDTIGVDKLDIVIITHCHWDHFGGAVSGGEIAFPNAEYVMSIREAKYIQENVKGWQLEYLNLIKGRTKYVEGISEISPGVVIRPAPGHTPGIVVVEVSSGGETLLYTSDTIIHKAHIEHMDWIPSFENDHSMAEQSRKRLVEDAHSRNLLLFVPHIPETLGRIKFDQMKYRWFTERM